uniref:Uncharacterized protein n=1 Tax=Cannabis sativa TaxID=3483 RepID=A0A803QRR8_CANSA
MRISDRLMTPVKVFPSRVRVRRCTLTTVVPQEVYEGVVVIWNYVKSDPRTLLEGTMRRLSPTTMAARSRKQLYICNAYNGEEFYDVAKKEVDSLL